MDRSKQEVKDPVCTDHNDQKHHADRHFRRPFPQAAVVIAALAEDAGDMAKKIAGEVAGKAKELTEEHGKVKELAQNAREQSATLALGAKEKVQGMIQDAKAIKEIKQGIAELEALPEIEGSIIYTMEIQTLVNNLRALYLLVDDKRLDDETVAGEIRKTMVKVVPDAETQTGEAAQQKTEEEKAIDSAKVIAYNACVRALESLKQDK